MIKPNVVRTNLLKELFELGERKGPEIVAKFGAIRGKAPKNLRSFEGEFRAIDEDREDRL